MIRLFLFSVLILSALGTIILHEYFSTPVTTPELQAEAMGYVHTNNKAVPPQPFTQDSCTLFPNRLPWHDFRTACLQHDIAYWAGGSGEERLAADVAFRDAISHTGPIGPVFGYLMYGGVRVFGDSLLTKLTNANWGYGWND